ncbi:MAG TPA: hypothetical protein VFD73_25030 [Gemmatimonadales bacterium]|nr:hypothetical protein [Gemmatimonadales bacterium]
MRRLASWSLDRVVGAWLAWFGLIVAALAFDVMRHWQTSAPAQRPESAAEPGKLDMIGAANTARQPTVPEQHTDFVYSVVVDRMMLMKLAILVIGPPTLLTGAGLYSRRSTHPAQRI